MSLTCCCLLSHFYHLVLRFSEWIPRCSQQHCHGCVDSSSVTKISGRMGGIFQLCGCVFAGDGRGQDDWRGHDSNQRSDAICSHCGAAGGDCVGFADLVVGTANFFFPCPDRWLCGRSRDARGWHVIVPEGWYKTLAFIVIAPLIGLVLGFIFMLSVFWLLRNKAPRPIDAWFRNCSYFPRRLTALATGG